MITSSLHSNKNQVLKNYQQKVIDKIEEYLSCAHNKYLKWLPNQDDEEYKHWVNSSMDKLSSDYSIFKNPNNEPFPLWTIKVPTGGGKTILAVETINKYFSKFIKRSTGLVLWLIHSDAIYSQTVNNLTNKSHFYRQILDNNFGANVLIKTKGQTISQEELDHNLVILVLMYPSLNRKNKETLKLFQDDGYLMNVFPSESNLSAHREILEQNNFLDIFEDIVGGQTKAQSQNQNAVIKTSIANFIRIQKPLFVVDEIHNFYSELGVQTLQSLNPRMVFGFSATPKSLIIKSTKKEYKPNVLIEIKGKDLQDEQMIKLDLNITEPNETESWQSILKKAINKQQYLEEQAIIVKNNGWRYIRPIVIVQVENTGKDTVGKDSIHSNDVKDYLLKSGIPESQIKRKTSEIKDELETGNDLLKSDCETRYILCKDAIKEGWDCPFAYILVILGNSSSNTGLQQLVGRILRQPYQTKLQPDPTLEQHPLDQSYVYYRTGKSKEILTQIQKGFQEIGIGDLVGNINIGSKNEAIINYVKSGIRSEVAQNHINSLYLPVFWNKKCNRKFSYITDIQNQIDYSKLELNYEIIAKCCISSQTQITNRISFSGGNGIETKQTEQVITKNDQLELTYLCSQIFGVIESSFVAGRLAKIFFDKINTHSDFETDFETYKNTAGSTICAEVIKQLKDYKETQTNLIYQKMLDSGEIILAMGDKDFGGYRLKNSVITNQNASVDNKYLYDKYDFEDIDGLEQKVQSKLLNSPNLVWWYRNPVKTGYSLSALHGNNIYPDFIVAKRITRGKNKGELTFTYLIESKGSHLAGNDDTKYKEYTFEAFNKLVSQKQIRQLKANNDTQISLMENQNLFQAELILDKNINRVDEIMKDGSEELFQD